jgi:hypothetical protein
LAHSVVVGTVVVVVVLRIPGSRKSWDHAGRDK